MLGVIGAWYNDWARIGDVYNANSYTVAAAIVKAENAADKARRAKSARRTGSGGVNKPQPNAAARVKTQTTPPTPVKPGPNGERDGSGQPVDAMNLDEGSSANGAGAGALSPVGVAAPGRYRE